MIKEIKFRGKYLLCGDWGVGNLIHSEQDNPYIIPKEIIKQDGHHLKIYEDEPFWVDKETVGQHIELKDKNKIDIFEGDILEDLHKNRRTVFRVPGGFAIEGSPDAFGYGYQNGNNVFESIADLQTRTWIEESCCVIGNIYDNKDLLK